MRVQREDVEDDGSAVEHAPLELVLERALLARAQRIVDHDDVGVLVLDELPELVDLAGAQVRRRVRIDAALHDDARGLHPGREQQLADLLERGVLIDTLREHCGDDGPLGHALSLYLDVRHWLPSLPRAGDPACARDYATSRMSSPMRSR